jgi:hypothetical protein
VDSDLPRWVIFPLRLFATALLLVVWVYVANLESFLAAGALGLPLPLRGAVGGDTAQISVFLPVGFLAASSERGHRLTLAATGAAVVFLASMPFFPPGPARTGQYVCSLAVVALVLALFLMTYERSTEGRRFKSAAVLVGLLLGGLSHALALGNFPESCAWALSLVGVCALNLREFKGSRQDRVLAGLTVLVVSFIAAAAFFALDPVR